MIKVKDTGESYEIIYGHRRLDVMIELYGEAIAFDLDTGEKLIIKKTGDRFYISGKVVIH